MTESLIHSTDTNLLDKYYESPLGQRKAKLREALNRFLNEKQIAERELFSRSRRRKLVHLRWEFYVTMKKMGYNNCDIGRFFKVDHTTVLHGCRAFESGNMPYNRENNNGAR